MKARLTFLGTASAVPNSDHHNTSLCVQYDQQTILIDCADSQIVRLEQAGISPLSLSDVVITHFHPDHVSGLPLLLMNLWLMGRKEPIHIHGLKQDMDRIEKMMALYNWHEWSGFYPVEFHRFSGKDQMELINNDQLHVCAFPVCHMIPAIGLKMEISGRSFCYSSDTAPCEKVIEMAIGVDILIHEATGKSDGHSSPEQAGHIAQKAGVKSLYLVHYPANTNLDNLLSLASGTFDGKIIIAEDLMTIDLT